MTQSQRETFAFTDAAEVFSDNLDALAIAMAGIYNKQGKKLGHASLMRDITNGRHHHHISVYRKITEFDTQKVNECFLLANLQFTVLEGYLNSLAETSLEIRVTMPPKNKNIEIGNIERMIKHLETIKSNLQGIDAQYKSENYYLPLMEEYIHE